MRFMMILDLGFLGSKREKFQSMRMMMFEVGVRSFGWILYLRKIILVFVWSMILEVKKVVDVIGFY